MLWWLTRCSSKSAFPMTAMLSRFVQGVCNSFSFIVCIICLWIAVLYNYRHSSENLLQQVVQIEDREVESSACDLMLAEQPSTHCFWQSQTVKFIHCPPPLHPNSPLIVRCLLQRFPQFCKARGHCRCIDESPRVTESISAKKKFILLCCKCSICLPIDSPQFVCLDSELL